METTEEKYPLITVEKRVKSKKPLRNEEGVLLYSDALKYILRVIPQDTPSYDFILTLASFAVCGRLSEKQAKKADEIIYFYEKEGVL